WEHPRQHPGEGRRELLVLAVLHREAEGQALLGHGQVRRQRRPGPDQQQPEVLLMLARRLLTAAAGAAAAAALLVARGAAVAAPDPEGCTTNLEFDSSIRTFKQVTGIELGAGPTGSSGRNKTEVLYQYGDALVADTATNPRVRVIPKVLGTSTLGTDPL